MCWELFMWPPAEMLSHCNALYRRPHGAMLFHGRRDHHPPHQPILLIHSQAWAMAGSPWLEGPFDNRTTNPSFHPFTFSLGAGFQAHTFQGCCGKLKTSKEKGWHTSWSQTLAHEFWEICSWGSYSLQRTLQQIFIAKKWIIYFLFTLDGKSQKIIILRLGRP